MNEITGKLLKTFKPRLAIIAYTSVMDEWNDCYLESHEIDKEGKLLEGKPLMQETIQEMVDVFFDERLNTVAVSGMLPVNMLQFEVLPGGRYSMIWHRPAEERNLFFTQSLHIPSGKAWVPAMIYKTDSRSLDVFAVASDLRPDEETKLMHAPFHNVSGDGSVCLGSAQVKKPSSKTYTALMKYWEDMFWLSEFSHLAGSKNPTKTNLALLWTKLIKDKKIKWESLDELLEIKNTTLKKIL